jgi:hypothetical protein
LGNNGKMGCHPVTKYCMPMPMTFDEIQYSASPLGNVNEKKAIINGIIQSIIVWLLLCFGSTDGVIVIFCWSQVDTNTRTGMMRFVGSGSARSSQRKFDCRGAAA